MPLTHFPKGITSFGIPVLGAGDLFTTTGSVFLRRRMSAPSGLPVVTMDERLLAALEAGLPDCAGVALGFDRLVMLAQGARAIRDVIAFPFDRA